jgi:PAS domain S-box-containing protein
MAGFIVLHFSVVREYKTISDTMVTEYRLLDQIPNLINAYNNAFKSIDSNNNVKTDDVVAIENEVHASLNYLDSAIIDDASKNDYLGLKNTIQDLEHKIDSGLQDLKNGQVSNASSYYDEANKQHAFVQSNAITLILDQLKYTASLQQQIDTTYKTTLYLAAAIFVITLIAVVLYVIAFARKLTSPLQDLSNVAQRIASGSKTTSFPTELTQGRDEISSLGRSFSVMVSRLLESNNKHDALLLSIGDGVIATDANGNVNYINTAAQQLFNLTEQDAIGKNYDQLWSVENEDKSKVDTVDRPIYKALHDGVSSSVSSFYYARTTTAGEQIRFAVSTNVSPVKMDSQTIGSVAVFRDITHERQVDRMKTEFISLASHQLRTPLSAIKWFSEMLLNGDAGELSTEQTDFAKNISDSTNRMVELVNSLLNISRIESGRMIIDPRPTDLKELIGGIVTDLKAKTEERQQTLIISVHSDLPKINLDPRLIGQVYLNLLTNAVKYTPKNGEISVMVSKKGDDVISQVTDNGYGIPKAQQSRVFEKFFRAENVAKFETDGTGLGLYLIKAVVESSGGKIWFESEEGKGTSFWFTLPLSGMKAKEGEVTLDM